MTTTASIDTVEKWRREGFSEEIIEIALQTPFVKNLLLLNPAKEIIEFIEEITDYKEKTCSVNVGEY